MSIDYTSYSNDETNEEKHVNELNYYDQTPEVEEETETNKEADVIMFKVANCEKCYVRESPSKESNHVAIVEKDADLMVIGDSISNEGELWHNVCTESGAEGYIMVKFTNDTQ